MARSRNGEAISARGRSPSAKKKLRGFIRERSKAGDLDEWRRGKAALGYIEGRRVVELAAELDVTRGSVNRWLQWYEAMGVEGLVTAAAPGAPSRVRLLQCAGPVTPRKNPSSADALLIPSCSFVKGRQLHGNGFSRAGAPWRVHTLRIVVVQDAAKEVWTLLVAALEGEPSVSDWEELVDHYHAMGHLWAAAQAMEGDASAIIARWKKALRQEDEAIDAIAKELEREVARGYLPTYRIAMENELTFITNNGAPMRYASLRDAGFPIGSSATEGACKSFFSVRCKRSGQRWRNDGLRATLTCRSLVLNDRLDRAVVTLRRRDFSAHVQAVPKMAA